MTECQKLTTTTTTAKKVTRKKWILMCKHTQKNKNKNA